MTLASTIWRHLSPGTWETVAELAHPGALSAIAAVRAGTGTTGELPVDVAVATLEQLPSDQRRAAAAGDTRTAVRDLIGEPAPKRARPKAPAAGLLTGATPAAAAAAVQARHRLSASNVSEYLAAPVAVRDAVAAHMLLRCTVDDSSDIFLELAGRGRAAITANTVELQISAGSHGLRTNSWTLRQRVRAAVAAAVTRAGIEILERPTGGSADDDEASPKPTPAAERVTLDRDATIDLAAAALSYVCAVRLDAAAAAAAIAAVRIPPHAVVQDRIRVAIIRTAGASGVPWPAIAEWHAATKDGPHSDAVLFELAMSDFDPEFVAAAVVASVTPASKVKTSVAEKLLVAAGDRFNASAALSLAVASQVGDSVLFKLCAGVYGPRVTAADLSEQLHSHSPLGSALRARLDRRVGSYKAIGLSAEQSACAALHAAWDRIISNHDTIHSIVVASDGTPAVAGAAAALARRLEAAAGPGASADTWAAICALAPSFAGTAEELVAVAEQAAA